ncbi:MATE family efflux transporter [Candidatus Kinetoplastidibacterium crithidiae]|uniref:Multidrug-efflux transporter n=1 Tax=Candidatus Kinetoplastidibacterium crithidiae TCC036E TaxID=1208918 RepID=M1LUC2_9PROT|nr:MATE family efflux transporter [Candidatus Kinetoplastibacterium crithidii]AGF47701.1 MATE family multidrug resistance protein [Candidatus Kinetoplastibacterium crithidii TCC036E]
MGQFWPILITQIVSVSYGLIDTIMSGHSSKEDLAVVALSSSIYITVFVSLIGVINSLIPIIANNFGKKKYEAIGVYWCQGVWIAILLSFIGSIFLYFPNIWFRFFGNMDENVYSNISSYLNILILALPASLIFRTIYNLCASLSRFKKLMFISILSIILKIIFNCLFIFGSKHIPKMGATGAALSTVIVTWINLIVALYIIKTDNFFSKFKLTIYKPKLTEIKELLKIGLPMSGSYLVEVLTFTSMAILVAQEGLVAIGGHQIIANIAGVTYVFPIALGIATSSAVAQAIGAENYQLAKEIGNIGLKLTIFLSLIIAILVFSNKENIINIYTNDNLIKNTILNLVMIVLPLFHIFDSIQCFNSYLLRAYKISTIPFITQIISLGVIGLGGGWWFGFGKGINYFEYINKIIAPESYIAVSSLWLLSTIGMIASSFFLYIIYIRVTNNYANKEIDIFK